MRKNCQRNCWNSRSQPPGGPITVSRRWLPEDTEKKMIKGVTVVTRSENWSSSEEIYKRNIFEDEPAIDDVKQRELMEILVDEKMLKSRPSLQATQAETSNSLRKMNSWRHSNCWRQAIGPTTTIDFTSNEWPRHLETWTRTSQWKSSKRKQRFLGTRFPSII